MDILIFILAMVVGFFAGVLVNAFADSMPQFRRPRLPFYSDGSERPILEWSGLVAYFAGGREKYDPTVPEPVEVEQPDGSTVMMMKVPPHKITIRHPLVEIFMVLFFGFITLNWPGHERIIIWFIYLTILMLVTVTDLEHYLILTPVIVPSSILAIIVAILFPEDGLSGGTAAYLIGGAVAVGIFLAMYWGGAVFAGIVSAARGEKLDEVAFGFGDVMLAALCGLMIGWQSLVIALLITVFLGALGAVLYLISRMLVNEQYSMFTPLPYGPYIVIGTVIMMLWREDIARLLDS